MDTSHFPSYTTLAAFAGVVSWVVFHKRTVRGDRAGVSYFLSVVILYLLLRHVRGPRDTALTTTVALSFIYFLALSTTTVTYRISPWHPLASYPGPFLARFSSLWLTYISSTGRRHFTIDRLHNKYGPFVRIGPDALSIKSLGGAPLYNYLEKSEWYRYPTHDDVVSIFLKQDDQEEHRKRRRIWGGFFTSSNISRLATALERRTWHLMRCIEHRQSAGGGYVDLVETLYHWTYDLGGDMIFGNFSELELMKNGDVRNLVAKGKFATATMDTFGQSPWLLDILWRIPVTKDSHEMAVMAADMSRKRMQSKERSTTGDLLSYLIGGGVPMSDIERDSMIAILAASENTTITMSTACYFLAAEPRYLEQLRAQLQETFPDPLGYLAPGALAALPLIDGIINEALRLSSLFFLPRVTPAGGVEVDGTHIPGETTIALATYSLHTSADYFYPEPMNFRPERWLPNGLGPDTITNRTAFAAFSSGQHACLGQTLAYQQMRYVLARLVLAFEIEFRPGFDCHAFREGILGFGTPRFEVPLHMTFTRRPGVQLDNVHETD